MKLSKQRVAAVGVLGVAVLALGADRFLLTTSISGPAAAGAAEAPVLAAASNPVLPTDAAASTESVRPPAKVELESVASRLRSDAELAAAADAKSISRDDAFVIPAGWLPQVAAETAPEGKPESTVPDAVTNFKATITAILGTQVAPVVQVAVEGGARQTVELGQTVGGLELLEVNVKQRTAVFGLNGFKKTLTLGTRNER